jgi:prepilin-type N-terminal cleavage/methylation domain-containing protein
VLQHLKERRQDETGFTLIELMVVVLIMGILMAIAIPTFLSTQGSANDASAKSNATNVFTGEKAYFEDNLAFIDASTTAPHNGIALDSGLPWGAQGQATVKGTVTAQVLTNANGANSAEINAVPWTGQTLLIEALSKSNNCFYIADDETTTPPTIAYAESSGGCLADGANLIFPSVSPLPSAGNAGRGIVAAASGKLASNAGWYASW